MSDPLTNIEIEDVLSSIRRLVSGGDTARPREASEDHDAPATHESLDSAASGRPAPQTAGKLVLTSAFLVVEGTEPTAGDADISGARPQTKDDSPVASPRHTQDRATERDAPMRLTQRVLDASTHAGQDDAEQDAEKTVRSINRSDLAVTIAELEAAISAGLDDYELDGTEDMSEAVSWPNAARKTDNIEEASVFSHTQGARDKADTDTQHAIKTPEADVYADDDIEGLMAQSGRPLDEAALRQLVRDIVHEELTGAMGERITRNVRKLVRGEIHRLLSSKDFD